MEKKILATLVLTMLSGLAFAQDNAAYNSSTTNQAADRVGTPAGHLSGSNEGMSGNTVGGDGEASDKMSSDGTSSSTMSADTSNGAENRVGAPAGHLSGANEGMSGTVLGGDGTASDNMASDSMSNGSNTTSATSLSGATDNVNGVTGIGDTMTFENLDTNSDGMVSRAEYDLAQTTANARMGSAMADDSAMQKGSDAGKAASPQSPGPGGLGMGVADHETAHKPAPQ